MKKKLLIYSIFLILIVLPISFAYDEWTRPPSCSIYGCTMQGDIDMGNHSIINVHWINATYTNISINYTQVTDPIWLNLTGGTMSGNINMRENKLTDVGELIVYGLTTAEDIIPHTDDLYSLGNSSSWWLEAYIKSIYSENVLTDFLNASEVNSTEMNSDNVNSNTVHVNENVTIGNHTLKKDVENNFVVILG